MRYSLACLLGLAILGGTGCSTLRPQLPGIGQFGLSREEQIQSTLSLARLTERRGEPAKAEQMYRQIIEKSPSLPTPYHRLGVMYAQQGQFDKAEAEFAHALKLTPDNAELLNDYGYFCYLTDKAEEAERQVRRATELEPANAAYWNNLAMIVGEQRRYDEALACFRHGGDEAEAQANLAYLYAQHGEMQRAIDAYSRALALDGELRPAAEALIQLTRYAPPEMRRGPGLRAPAAPVPYAGQRLMAAVQPTGPAAMAAPVATSPNGLATMPPTAPQGAAGPVNVGFGHPSSSIAAPPLAMGQQMQHPHVGGAPQLSPQAVMMPAGLGSSSPQYVTVPPPAMSAPPMSMPQGWQPGWQPCSATVSVGPQGAPGAVQPIATTMPGSVQPGPGPTTYQR